MHTYYISTQKMILIISTNNQSVMAYILKLNKT